MAGRVRQLLSALGNINGEDVKSKAKLAVATPRNVAFLIWAISTLVTGIIWLLLEVGALNKAMSKREKKLWEEVTVQILNGLFTAMALFYQHPRCFLHCFYAIRYTPHDAFKLQQAYCKDGQPKPHERRHIAVVLLLTHLYCLAQYASAVLYWIYSPSNRPAVGVDITFSVAIAAAVAARRYTKRSPLGRDYPSVPIFPGYATNV